ncbi:C6 transcription factor [Xylogone sp. PMI_703]|nr:C6 transcription factor [Xylogone sp. PMI_703]
MSNKALRSTPEYRTRRAHKKSRNGCIKCKQRKKKCNEAIPSCSRCVKNGLVCQYQERLSGSASVDVQTSMSCALLNSFQIKKQSLIIHDQSLPWVPSPPSDKLPSIFLDSGEAGQFYPNMCTPDNFLDATELELLTHYLVHTSRIIPFDVEDLYALQVGIPNLAFHSKPLMSSILALAATCKSHDILKQPTITAEDKGKIWDLLVLADQHHRTSLLQVQADLPNLNQYDYVLANTAIMVLYATANHCLRIRLAETQLSNEPLLREFIPVQSQWVSLIRAAHLAFTGLLNDDSEMAEISQERIEHPLLSTHPSIGIQDAFNHQAIFSEDGPSGRTKTLLFPIAAASSGPALQALRMKAQSFRSAEGTKAQLVSPLKDSSVCDVDLQACFKSLDILVDITTEVFSTKDRFSSATSCNSPFLPKLDLLPPGRLSMVPMWLKSYLARVTSSISTPRPLRRVVMAFLNRVPAEYLCLVQSILDSIGTQASDCDQGSWESPGSDLPEPSDVHKLAMDIFAHWTVLVMMLDGVWWIGGIGAWELGRIVRFVRSQHWLDPTTDAEKHWWPESMYNIERELKKLV